MVAKGRRTAGEKAAEIRELSMMDRPPPPGHLNKEAAQEWTEIVQTYPPDRFLRGTWPILEGLCVHAVQARRIMSMLDGITADTSVSDYDRLLKMLDRETKSVASFGVRLGIARTSMSGRHNSDPETVAEGRLPWKDRN